jgi:methanogenic corrinoid protein MtbC1
VDLGVDVPPTQFVSTIRRIRPQVVGLSALLSTALSSIDRTVGEIKKAGLRENVKIMVGGSAVTAEFAKEIGADGYGADATDAPKLAQGFVRRRTAA